MGQSTQWVRGLTYDIDPDAKLLYNVDLSDWFPEEWEIDDLTLIYDEEEIEVPYESLDTEGKSIAFKVENVINNGKKIPITLRITVTNSVIEQRDDRTIYFRARQF